MKLYNIRNHQILNLTNIREFFKLNFNNERKTIIKEERIDGKEKEK